MTTEKTYPSMPPLADTDIFGSLSDIDSDENSNEAVPRMKFTMKDTSNNNLTIDGAHTIFAFTHLEKNENLTPKEQSLKQVISIINNNNDDTFKLKSTRKIDQTAITTQKKKEKPNKDTVLFPRCLCAKLFSPKTKLSLHKAYERVSSKQKELVKNNKRSELQAEFKLASYYTPYKESYLEYALRVSNYHIYYVLPFPFENGEKSLTAQLVLYNANANNTDRIPYFLITTTVSDFEYMLNHERLKQFLKDHTLVSHEQS